MYNPMVFNTNTKTSTAIPILPPTAWKQRIWDMHNGAKLLLFFLIFWTDHETIEDKTTGGEG